jgi:hypothetical protein
MLGQAEAIEQECRTHAMTTDLPEKDAAVVAVRLLVPFKRQLEHWISRRALRAQLPRSA